MGLPFSHAASCKEDRRPGRLAGAKGAMRAKRLAGRLGHDALLGSSLLSIATVSGDELQAGRDVSGLPFRIDVILTKLRLFFDGIARRLGRIRATGGFGNFVRAKIEKPNHIQPCRAPPRG
jgi:hypothetical protein